MPRQGSPVPMGVGTRQSFSPARSNSIPGASESSSQTSLTFVTPPSSPLATRKGRLTLFNLMDYPIHIDAISMESSILKFMGLLVKISIKS